jgi:hypothetical protein
MNISSATKIASRDITIYSIAACPYAQRTRILLGIRNIDAGLVERQHRCLRITTSSFTPTTRLVSPTAQFRRDMNVARLIQKFPLMRGRCRQRI